MNTAQLWDGLWNKSSLAQLEFSVASEEKSAIWVGIEKALREMGLSRPPQVLELGAGSGINSAVFARKGAQVTVLDYSEKALEVSGRLFSALGLKQTQVQANALALPNALRESFDVAMSFGVCEHFEGDDRRRIVSGHFDALRPGGLAVISVPNARCVPYRIWKAKREFMGTWRFGLEIPFSRSEFSGICEDAGIREYGFIGSSCSDSLGYLLPISRWKRSLLKRLAPHRLYDVRRLKQARPFVLDEYYGAALVLLARKPFP